MPFITLSSRSYVVPFHKTFRSFFWSFLFFLFFLSVCRYMMWVRAFSMLAFALLESLFLFGERTAIFPILRVCNNETCSERVFLLYRHNKVHTSKYTLLLFFSDLKKFLAYAHKLYEIFIFIDCICLSSLMMLFIVTCSIFFSFVLFLFFILYTYLSINMWMIPCFT